MRVSIGVKISETKYYFSSKIEDLEEDNIILNMPMRLGRIFFLGINEKIYIYFSKKGSYYCLEGKVVDKKYDPIPVISVKPLKEPYKEQKRSYFRLEITLKALIKINNCDNWHESYTRDLSAGGVRLSFSNKIKKGSIIQLKIPEILGDEVLKAIVVRMQKHSLKPKRYYDIAAMFIEVNEQTQDKIVKYLLAEQRELRKKGIE